MNDTSRPRVLIGLNDELKGKRFELGPRISLGRSISSDIFLPDPSIGRHHCQIETSAQGIEVFRTTRDASLMVNGVAVTQAALQPDDLIEVGRFQLRLSVGDQTELPTVSRESDEAESPATEPPSLAGAVLCVEVASAINSIEAVEHHQEFLEELTPLMSRTGARCLSTSWNSALYDWPTPLPENTQENDPTFLPVRAAQQITQIAFLRNRHHAFHVRVGVGHGEYSLLETSNDYYVQGTAVDQARRLALETAPNQISISDDLPTTPSTVRYAPTNGTGARLAGLFQSCEGRRFKMEIAQSVTISRFGLQLEGMLVRLTHDPETDRITMTMIALAPLEIGAEYMLSSEQGITLTLECMTSRQIHQRAVQAQFCCLGSRETAGKFLGFALEPETESTSIARAA